MTKNEQQMYVQGYKTGYLTAMHFVSHNGDDNEELVEKMRDYYNSHPMIEPITEFKNKEDI